MIKLIPIRFWKNFSLASFLRGLSFALDGTFCIKGNLVVHWSDEGVPYKLTFFVTIVVHVESLFKNPLIRCSTMDTAIFSFKIYTIR